MSPLLPVFTALLAVSVGTSSLRAQSLISIETAAVGDPGNAADNTGYGAVAYQFNIGTYEVTIGQYTTFLNSVASVASETYIVDLWNANMASNQNVSGISRTGSGVLESPYSYSVLGGGSRPVTYVSWFDAARFVNWVHNGATNGASTETGAYTLNGAATGIGFTKNPDAAWWIPSENEWFKAAYYKGGGTNAEYWLYPTQSDSAPGNAIGGATNQANYRAAPDFDYATTGSATYSESQNYLTDVGSFSASASAYGTHDQAGNVFEWNDQIYNDPGGERRGIGGGSWSTTENDIMSDRGRLSISPESEHNYTGFRVAAVPEPSVFTLLLASAGVWWIVRRRRQKCKIR